MDPPPPNDGICAIFVHAGAGFHNFENEHKHLGACDSATTAAMAFLKAGGTAVDAVEVALTVLEDNPITNAGYGSNLNHNGIVECDASIVDHRGKSGAVGAVPNVKNPIALARKIYDESNKDMGQSRVPPNFIIGEGARDFAWENGIVVLPHDDMTHPAARLRWKSWKEEVDDHERVKGSQNADPWLRRPLTPMGTRLERLAKRESLAAADHEANEEYMPDLPVSNPGGHATVAKIASLSSRDGSPDIETDTETEPSTSDQEDVDMISDTIGAIAIDRWGNIAAGSSSGGIGMKHRGRVGPAALIGIGTHVVPVDPTDPDGTTVACVTSGTGELIASAFVAYTLSQRVYFSQKKCENGRFEQEVDQVVISEYFKNEFTNFPAVDDSFLFGSLGAMVVRKDNDGIELFFAHNTQSFAIGSMSSNREKPVCVMSRGNRGSIMQGGARVRF